jgi:hypothetical protein
MHILPISLSITPTLELLGDIATTAAEGGIGYWAVADEYVWARDEDKGKPVMEWRPKPFPTLVISPRDEPDDFPARTVVTPEVIHRGIQRLLMLPNINPQTKEYVTRALVENDACNIDANISDLIVQLGLFDTEVFC